MSSGHPRARRTSSPKHHGQEAAPAVDFGVPPPTAEGTSVGCWLGALAATLAAGGVLRRRGWSRRRGASTPVWRRVLTADVKAAAPMPDPEEPEEEDEEAWQKARPLAEMVRP